MANSTVKAVINPKSELERDGFMAHLTLSSLSDAPLNVGAQVAFQADTTAVDLAALKVDFNALLTKLKTAGVMASS